MPREGSFHFFPKFLSFAVLTLVLSSATSLVLGLQQYNTSISSHGTVDYSTTVNISRLHVEGTQIKDQFGKRVYLKGVNLETKEWWSEGYGTEQQFIYIKNWGFNVVRVVIQAWAIEAGVMNNPNFLGRLDNMISWAEKHGMYVVLDGWHNSGWTSDGIYRFDVSKYMVDKWDDWIEQWRFLATRYKGRINVLYDLMNEPIYVPSNEFYQTKMRQAIDMIRAIDPNVVIIVEEMSTGDWDGMGFSFEQTHPINRPNVIFSGHQYGSGPKGWILPSDKVSIRQLLSMKKWDWVLQNGRAVWIGECGVYNADGLVIQEKTWLRNFMEVCAEDGYSGWCAWRWATSGWYYVLADWSGNPSDYGKILQEFL